MKRLLLPVLLLAPLLVASPAAADRPRLTVTVVQDGLQLPWDLAFLPDGSMLVTERSSKRLSRIAPGGKPRTIFTSPRHMWAAGETGLMSVEIAADYAKTRDFITCHGYRSGSTRDVRVVRWHLNKSLTSASYVRTLVSGLPSSGGRHGGCALAKGSGNQLYVGTGDAASGRTPQRLTSGGGKVLRIDAKTGKGVRTNPYARSSSAMKRRIFTYGHRNVQGLARRSDRSMWSVEQGSYRDDEVNRLFKGSNYGWNPVPRKTSDPAYNEGANSPMTDTSIQGRQRGAKWRSGNRTFATSGATFIAGRAWAGWNGALAATALKDSSLRLMLFNSKGALRTVWKPKELDGKYGRLRGAVRRGSALYLTTSNGDGNDKILKVTAKP